MIIATGKSVDELIADGGRFVEVIKDAFLNIVYHIIYFAFLL